MVLPEELKTIDLWAFANCTGITSITIPKTAYAISYVNAFQGDLALKEINVDPENTNYSSQDGVLYNSDKTHLLCCPNGKEGTLTIPDGVTNISYGALKGCEKLDTLFIPSTMDYIDDEGMAECSGLKTVEVDKLTPPTVGTDAFRNIDFDKVLLFVPATAETDYADHADWGQFKLIIGGNKTVEVDGIYYTLYPNMKADVAPHPTGYEGDIVIPASVTWGQDFEVSGAHYAFAGCSNLNSVTLPASVYNLEEADFVNSSKLTTINIAPENTDLCSVDGVVFSKDKTVLIAYPGGKEGPYVIPDGTTLIEVGAFQAASKLAKVTIPAEVTTIADYAFRNAVIDTILCHALTPPALGTEVLYGIPSYDSLFSLDHIFLSLGNTVQPFKVFFVKTSITRIPDTLKFNALPESQLTFDSDDRFIDLLLCI